MAASDVDPHTLLSTWPSAVVPISDVWVVLSHPVFVAEVDAVEVEAVLKSKRRQILLTYLLVDFVLDPSITLALFGLILSSLAADVEPEHHEIGDDDRLVARLAIRLHE